MTDFAPRYLSEDEKEFIRANYGKMSYKEMAEHLYPRKESTIKTWCRKGIANKVDRGKSRFSRKTTAHTCDENFFERETVAFDQDIPDNVKKVIIVDDILDYGGTFIPLAQELKQRGIEVHLHVTHLIAAGGLERFRGYIDKIFCYHTVAGYVTMDDVLKFNNSSLNVKRED